MDTLTDPQLIEPASQISPFSTAIVHDGSVPLLPQMLTADLDTLVSIQGTPPTIETTSPMDTSGQAPPPGSISDFPPPPANLTFSASDPIDILETAASLSTRSSSSTSAVSNTSHVSSSPVNSMPPGFVPGTSSLASALDDLVVNRTRTNSSASPPRFPGSTQIEPLIPEAVITLSAEMVRSALGIEASSTGGAPTKVAPLQAVDNMLRRVQQSVFSAREACSMGQPMEANIRVEELVRTVQAVADLIASTHIVDGPVPSPNANRTATGYSPPDHPPPGTNESMEYDHNVLDQIADPSRKRCASSLGLERVIKAPKLEPLDDPLHSIQPSIGVAPPHPLPTVINSTIPALNPGPAFPFGLSHPLPDPVPPPAPSHPPSQPASRPPSADSGHPTLTTAGHIPPPLVLNQRGGSGLPSQIPPAPFSSPPVPGVAWADTRAPFPGRPHHQHSHSGSSIHSMIPISDPPALSYPQIGNGFSSALPPSSHPPPLHTLPVMSTSMAQVPSPTRPVHAVRPSRSSSLSNVYLPSYDVHSGVITAASTPQTPIASSPEDECDDSDGEDHSQSPPLTTYGKNKRARPDDAGPSSGSRPKNGRRTSTTDANEIPTEYKAEVDRIFFEFLGNICSNLDSTDAKGEAIHQTLMAKKMQRLDESPDFRPFKFRIQAFTNAFLEELARQNLSDDKIPMKKIRNYLWNQPYISRFNEEGKKTKSKGNHIWHIDAKKGQDGSWKFRPFHRRLAGSPPTVAYVGLRWSWQPRVWDPQGAKFSGIVRYASPSLPAWLSWKDDVLSGIPPPDAQSCEVTVTAEFNVDGQDELLSQTIQITIAPMTAIDSTLSTSRRPSLIGAADARRVQSDSVVQQSGPSNQTWMGQRSSAPAPHVTPNAQIVQVLNTAVEQVSQAVQEQVVASRHPVEHSPELQALAKQQHVLSVSAQALDSKGANPAGSSSAANVLVAAAHQVVYKAAVQVATTNSVIQSLPVTTTQLSVQDVSAATLSAVAQAVDLVGPLSSEVDVMMTASSLLSHQASIVSPAPGNVSMSGPLPGAPVEMQH